ncbi:MAG: carboxylesterase [Betaproteobacteria bacterium]|nr:carboxylesterase [Betaproteobacteria bacterium]
MPAMADLLDCIEIESAPSPDAAVIWLHGLGADANDFVPVVPELGLPAGAAIRFVFPNAPKRPVTINMGMRMPAWYDILQMGGGPEDAAGIRESQAQIEALVAREQRRGVAAKRIALAGFSQGGAIVLHTGLRHPERLAGILALSTYLPLADTLETERHEANRNLPIFYAHGQYDPMIGIERAERSRRKLESLGYAVQFASYPMEHSVCAEEIADIGAWLAAVLSA